MLQLYHMMLINDLGYYYDVQDIPPLWGWRSDQMLRKTIWAVEEIVGFRIIRTYRLPPQSFLNEAHTLANPDDAMADFRFTGMGRHVLRESRLFLSEYDQLLQRLRSLALQELRQVEGHKPHPMHNRLPTGWEALMNSGRITRNGE
jgi:hypothetical protein